MRFRNAEIERKTRAWRQRGWVTELIGHQAEVSRQDHLEDDGRALASGVVCNRFLQRFAGQFQVEHRQAMIRRRGMQPLQEPLMYAV